MIKNFLMRLKEEGWTQEQIAEKVGVRQNQVSTLLKGGDIKLSTLLKFADAFGISLDEVVGRNTPEKKPISNSIRDHTKGRKLRNEI